MKADTENALSTSLMDGPALAENDFDARTRFSPFPMAIVEGADHRLRYVNPAFCQQAGKSAEELYGTAIAQSLPLGNSVSSLLTRVMLTGKAEREVGQEPRESGTISWSYSAWPVVAQPNERRGAMILMTDDPASPSRSTDMTEALMISAVHQHELAEIADILVTRMGLEIDERKKTEEALRTSELRLLMALESAKASLWELNLDTDRVKWSYEARAARGGWRSDREVSIKAWRSIVLPDDQPLVDSVAQRAARGKDQIRLEFRVRQGNGTILWMFARGRLGVSSDGRHPCYSGILIDITERKHAEQVLLTNEKLAGAGRMAATLAHEINNPLDAAMNAVYLVRTAPDTPDSVFKYLDIADEELRRVAHMTRQSLGFYRETTCPITFEVDSLLDSVLGLLKNRIAIKSIVVERQTAPHQKMTAQFGELRQVLVNLIANSLDALETGGKILLRTSQTSTASNGTPRIRITIADTGRGINALHLARIFEPFYTTKGELGTGLGLWVTKQLVEKHGGTIQMRTRTTHPGSGTVVSINLPN